MSLKLILTSMLVLTFNIAQTIKENVMLFEDILEDLQAGYVDPVNPTKLFETAVSAMLKVSTVVRMSLINSTSINMSMNMRRTRQD